MAGAVPVYVAWVRAVPLVVAGMLRTSAVVWAVVVVAPRGAVPPAWVALADGAPEAAGVVAPAVAGVRTGLAWAAGRPILAGSAGGVVPPVGVWRASGAAVLAGVAVGVRVDVAVACGLRAGVAGGGGVVLAVAVGVRTGVTVGGGVVVAVPAPGAAIVGDGLAGGLVVAGGGVLDAVGRLAACAAARALRAG